jgi:hypothetical protein
MLSAVRISIFMRERTAFDPKWKCSVNWFLEIRIAAAETSTTGVNSGCQYLHTIIRRHTIMLAGACLPHDPGSLLKGIMGH